MILLAVALFVTLSYAVTQSTRSGGGDTQKENALLWSSQIQQYGSTIRQAIIRVKISNGCTNEQISFENPNESGLYINPNSPVNKSCHIFDPAGGGVVWQKPPVGIAETGTFNTTGNYLFTGGTCVAGIGLGGDNSCWNNGILDDTELIMMVNYLSDTNCLAYNSSIKAGTPDNLTLITSSGGSFSALPNNWRGEWGYGGGDTRSAHIHNATTINGKSSLCYKGDITPGNHIYITLIER